MTAQVPEIYCYKGLELYSNDYPLAAVLKAGNSRAISVSSTANKRGYVASWMVVDSYLNLIGIDSKMSKPVGDKKARDIINHVNLIREGKCSKLRADWFSGDIDAFDKYGPSVWCKAGRLPRYWLKLRIRKGFVMQESFRCVVDGDEETRQLCQKIIDSKKYGNDPTSWLDC